MLSDEQLVRRAEALRDMMFQASGSSLPPPPGWPLGPITAVAAKALALCLAWDLLAPALGIPPLTAPIAAALLLLAAASRPWR